MLFRVLLNLVIAKTIIQPVIWSACDRVVPSYLDYNSNLSYVPLISLGSC